MARILLGVTGSVAAIKTPELFRALRGSGHNVRIVATEPSLAFFRPGDLGESGVVYRDADEWPTGGWSRGDPVLHIAFRDWADLLVVAPLDANTLGKFALGMCDNFLTCVIRAWDFGKPIILAPAMNTRMWDHPATVRHLRMILEDHGDGRRPAVWTLDEAASLFATHAPRIVLVPPQSKRLACGDVGVGAMADVVGIAEEVRRITATVHLG
jgi:phosphopantothenoylcysteine decarboxylase